VKNADYPGVVDVEVGKGVMGKELSEDEGCVRGVLVRGLTWDDVEVLDEFEGDVCHLPSIFVRRRSRSIYTGI